MRNSSVRTRPLLQAALGATFLSASPILMTLANVGPVTVAFYRCALPLPVLAVLAVLEQRRHGPRPATSRGHAVLAGLFFAANLILWNHSIADVGAGVATVLGNLQILFVVAIAFAFLHERPDRRYLVVLPAVLLGIVMLSGVAGGDTSGPHPVTGVVYGLATSATYACFLLILRQTGGATRNVAGQLFDATAGATAGALIFGLAFGNLQPAISWAALGWLLVLALSSGIVGWLLITASLPHLPAGLSSLLLLLEPAGAMILAPIILDQPTGAVQIAGAALICGGVLMAMRSQDRAAAEMATDSG